MTTKDESVIFPSILLGIVIGFCIGCYVDRKYMTWLHWNQLVERGYAEQVETSLGTGYRWKVD